MIEVCFSPALLPYHKVSGKVVVIIDVLRATSVVCTGLANGVQAVIPVASLEEARAYRQKGYTVAAERGGSIPEGFDLGNSPLAWQEAFIKGQTVILTTTNGTQAIAMAQEADCILTGAFLNAGALAEHLKTLEKDVLILCAGWQNRFSLEDTMCAGMLLALMGNENHHLKDDEALTALDLYRSHQDGLQDFLAGSAHAQRLTGLQHQKDFEFCMQRNLYDVIPVLEDSQLVSHNKMSNGANA